MTPPAPICVDFETKPIEQRPKYPPEPVGVSIKWPGAASVYMAFGHPTNNNCTPMQALEELERVRNSGLPLLFHNAKFDLAVLYEWCDWPEVPWDRVHDTMFLAYLVDPHARQLGLKPLAADLLHWPADERDALAMWVWEHRAALTALYGKAPSGTHKGGATHVGEWIWTTPGDLCGAYANGDTDRTLALFEHLWPVVQDNGMGPAYDRERQLLPILMENEATGMRVDLEALERDTANYAADFESAETWLRQELHASGLNFDADDDVAAILLERGVVPKENWQLTKTGKLSMSKEALLPEMFISPRGQSGPNGAAIASVLGYRNRLSTCLNMFMRPWAAQARVNNGYITTNWNQTRGAQGGTRTGRPSTDRHNFLNLSKTWDGRDDGYVHPAFLGVEVLPLVRRYVVPDVGHVFQHRDFDGQELRVFGHFEQGALWRQYQNNPSLDPHAFIGDELQRVAGRDLGRTRVKTLNFQGIYGGGVPALQKKLRCTVQEAKELKTFHNAALPGRQIVNDEIKRIVNRGLPICTWGGRLYFPEAPDANGRDKVYKLLNYLVQGSAADLTKQTLIDWHGHPLRTSRFMVTVYDEINISTPPGDVEAEMRLLREVMELPRLSVPMRSSGKRGPSWGELTKCE
jgi:DNA polymerase I-like protein with 3'-5' exonuclease and polymerase domains